MKIKSVGLVIPLIASVIVVGGLVPFSFSSEHTLSINPEIEQPGILYGYQVVEVKVSNPDLSDTMSAKGEPDVSVNGKIIRMTQANDGNWYGYIASFAQAQIADSSSTDVNGQKVNFGTFCGDDSTILGINVDDTVGIAVNSQDGIEGTDPETDPTPDCNVTITPDDSINVLDDVPQINTKSPIGDGQIGVASGAWPFIQLYPITESSGVTIQYVVGGGLEEIILQYIEESPSPDQLMNNLISQIEGLSLSSKSESKLTSHLNKILSNLDDGNDKNNKNICKSLDVFEKQLKPLTGKEISPSEAEDLSDLTKIAKQVIC
jgi:hypothetical protein